MEEGTLLKLLTTFQSFTRKPEVYLGLQEKEAEDIKELTKNLYCYTKKNEKKKKKSEALNELIISNFDEEQIWQQIELQNNVVYESLVNDISHLVVKKENLKFPLREKSQETKQQQISGKDENEEDEKEKEMEKVVSKSKEKVTDKKNVKSSVVDDQFFKLHEMENFLEKMEKDPQEKGDSDVDYFETDESEASDCENQPHYNDFFDQPGDFSTSRKRKDSFSESDSELETKNHKKAKFNLEEEDESDDGFDIEEADLEGKDEEYDVDDEDKEDFNFDGNDNVDDSDSEDDLNKSKNLNCKKENKTPSGFEARQERLKSRISALEEEALKEKPWQLKGEVTANSRPPNSLLQEYVEFDIASRPPPVLTEKSTLKLEDIIIQRIKDKAWDDVVRKIKPVESEMEYKKKLVLDQEKSKLSLAQIYEQEYLKQLESKSEDLIDKHEIEPKEHQEIKIMLAQLFSKLDALSNFHFTPKQAEPEIKIISNIPAITIEEVAPTATSDATLLAPEEVKAKLKGDLIGKSERTATHKKRERRQKKLKQKLKHKEEESKNKTVISKDNESKISKNKKLSKQFLQKVTKSSTVTQLKENGDGKFIKSSNAFFSKLQDDATSMIKKKGFELKSKSIGKKLNSKKVKSR